MATVLAHLATNAYADPLPDFRGLSTSEAESLATDLDLTLVIELIAADTTVGRVIDQLPDASTELAGERRVMLWVSDGLRVPDLQGLKLEVAVAKLTDLGVASEVSRAPIVGTSVEHVGRQVPSPGDQIDASQDTVFLTVSVADQVVPDLSGKHVYRAFEELAEVGLRAEEVPEVAWLPGEPWSFPRAFCGTVTDTRYLVTKSEPAVGAPIVTGEIVQLFYEEIVDTHNFGICPPPRRPGGLILEQDLFKFDTGR